MFRLLVWTLANGCAEGQKKKKKDRKDPKERKKRKLAMHQVWVVAGMDALGPNDKKGRSRGFVALAGFKRSLSKEAVEKFETDYEPVLTALNDAPERYKDDIRTLVVNRNKELGIERHAAFKGLEVRRFLVMLVRAS
jgi:hypothetical protein